MTGFLQKLLMANIFAMGVVILATSQPAPATAAELKKVTVRLAFSYNGHRSPYLLGVEKGFYKDEGLDVKVFKGTGFMPAMQLLVSKQDHFAIINGPTIMFARSRGMRVRQVFQVYHKSPNSIISWKTANVKGPKDLSGKTVAVIQSDTQIALIKAMMRAQKLNPESVKFFAADGGTRTQVFLAKKTQSINGFSIDSYISLKNKTDGAVEQFLLSDYGIDTMGDGIAAHEDLIKSSPDTIRRFIRATIKSFEYAVQHPKEAIDALAKIKPTVNRRDAEEKLIATVPFIMSPEAKEHGMGFNIPDRWKATEQLMIKYGGLKQPASNISEYFTNDFLPKKK